jgi:hypothetical protein
MLLGCRKGAVWISLSLDCSSSRVGRDVYTPSSSSPPHTYIPPPSFAHTLDMDPFAQEITVRAASIESE